MGKKKTTRPATQAVTPAYITVAEQLAYEVCERLGTTPPQAAKNQNAALAKHGGHTGGLRSVTANDLFSDPDRIIQAARDDLQKDIVEERLAAVLWIGAQFAKALARQPNGNSATLADLSWTLSRIVTALQFPELRERLLVELQPEIPKTESVSEWRGKSSNTRKRKAMAWQVYAERAARNCIRANPKATDQDVFAACYKELARKNARFTELFGRRKFIPSETYLLRHIKKMKIFSSERPQHRRGKSRRPRSKTS